MHHHCSSRALNPKTLNRVLFRCTYFQSQVQQLKQKEAKRRRIRAEEEAAAASASEKDAKAEDEPLTLGEPGEVEYWQPGK